MKFRYVQITLLGMFFLFASCSNKEIKNPMEITSFKFEAEKNPGLDRDIVGVIDNISETISVVISDKDLEKHLFTTFTPSIKFEGVKVYPPDVKFDFSDPAEYVVYSKNGDFKTYSVDVLFKDIFISKWKVKVNEEVCLPIYNGGTYDFYVNWGDGTTDEHIRNWTDGRHRYTASDKYTITITGKIQGFNFGEVRESRDKIIDISSWGNLKLGNRGSHFNKCTNLNISSKDNPNLKGVTNMSGMFSGCTKFNGNISDWDMSNVTNIAGMFSRASSFNQDISRWDVSNVINMSTLFTEATLFNQDISGWDVSKVTNMEALFTRATSFNQNINRWDVSSVTNMKGMFSKAENFNQPLNDWDISKVRNMSFMFSAADSFNQDISPWKVEKVTSCRLFNYAGVLSPAFRPNFTACNF
ncbi:BspA family leucine-rich repeat surface protein [Ichthyobacterium seriolicida]|uniref:PKD domain-containing protein n=1 Tax=Ichthyobacterium seriolicida TaxID=242600 RepID=A0A1J1DYD1_9FLAO|nr:BspA family leucine-rich repeat surface protein [Ichthyobacterium seriolicida]BAV94895.1 hypothetical protein JBKA6_0882 [Ichthyobacterium seriolicida]